MKIRENIKIFIKITLKCEKILMFEAIYKGKKFALEQP